MLWQVQVSLADRPGAMARLAAACGDHDVTVLALDVLPDRDGELTDALVLHAPDGWTSADVQRLCRGAGAGDAQPVRRLRRRERKAGHPSMGTITPPLVALLHHRSELREVLPAADLIDSAIREGA